MNLGDPKKASFLNIPFHIYPKMDISSLRYYQGGTMHMDNEEFEYLHYIGSGTVKKFLSMMILWMLSKKQMHGYAIIEILQQQCHVKSGTPSKIYPILKKLEKKGLVITEKIKQGKRIRKEYKTSTKGKKMLKTIKKMIMQGPVKEFFKEMGS